MSVPPSYDESIDISQLKKQSKECNDDNFIELLQTKTRQIDDNKNMYCTKYLELFKQRFRESINKYINKKTLMDIAEKGVNNFRIDFNYGRYDYDIKQINIEYGPKLEGKHVIHDNNMHIHIKLVADNKDNKKIPEISITKIENKKIWKYFKHETVKHIYMNISIKVAMDVIKDELEKLGLNCDISWSYSMSVTW